MMIRSLIFLVWSSLCAAALFHASDSAVAQGPNNCLECHSRQKDEPGAVVAIYKTSTHYRMALGCDDCHGGDRSQTEKTKAHAGRFVARPDTAATLEMCGRCHREPLEFFKSSRHFAVRPNVKRLDCVECHGVHAIGAASKSFRWPQFCAGCHGLEYLPPLPKQFQEMLSMVDDLNEGLHRVEAKGRVSPELIQKRNEVRHMISDLVHRTQSKAGGEDIPHILELGGALKRQIITEQNH